MLVGKSASDPDFSTKPVVAMKACFLQGLPGTVLTRISNDVVDVCVPTVNTRAVLNRPPFHSAHCIMGALGATASDVIFSGAGPPSENWLPGAIEEVRSLSLERAGVRAGRDPRCLATYPS